ncbi:cytoplasmic phosphatidylinositol transfer protein 1 isoform X2 [Euwallacea fornicatus]
MIAKHSLEQSGDGVGVEVVENKEIVDSEHGKGQYTEKKIHLSNRLPYWIQAIIPKLFYVTEKAWNYYPYTITDYTCSFIPRFHISIHTRYENNNGTSENCLNLSPDQLAERIVEHIDIAYDEVAAKHYKEEEDLRFFKSAKTSRGPLIEGWRTNYQPIMCSYKLVNVYFEVFGLQTKTEEFIHSCIHEILLLGHRQAFAWMDEWIDMSMDDVRKYEIELQDQANTLLKESGTIAEDSMLTEEGAEKIEIEEGLGGLETPKTPVKKGYFNWF